MSTRSYLPGTSQVLRVLAQEGVWVLPDTVSPLVAEGEDEEQEYAALMTAADESTRLAVDQGVAGLRRVVLVVETPALPAAGDRVELREVVALHVDTDDRTESSDPDDDLAWFGVQELAHLV